MIIGVPKEIKNGEYRVAITPAGVMSLVDNGHEVVIEKKAGNGSGFDDSSYIEVGAKIVDDAADVWKADMVVKVKEPIESEYHYFRDGLILFTYLHLAPEIELTKRLIDSGVISIAYETVQLSDGSLPLLTPMSEVAGRMAVQIGARLLEKNSGGKGILLSGVPGVAKANVTIIGGGVVGVNAISMALGLGAKVTVLDVNLSRLRELEDIFGNRLQTLVSNSYNIAKSIEQADLAIGAVLLVGAKAPRLVTKQMVTKMAPGSVIIDVAIDQGGIFETIDHITTHHNPTYIKHEVIHYAVANMPGGVPRTSTLALTNATLPYVLALANKGYTKACLEDEALLKGISTLKNKLTCEAVAQAQQLCFEDAKTLLTN